MTSLWVGGKLGVLFPFGYSWGTTYDVYGNLAGESWSGMAAGGPAFEGDVGVRVARRYIIYGFWEHAFMSTGGDPTWRAFGDQTSASTDFTGLGFRWSSRPDTVGFLVDLGIGYRWFRENWSNGTSITLQGFGEFRAGFGADIRLTRQLSIEPIFSFSTGEFHDREVSAPGMPSGPIQSYTASHGTVTLSLGGHFDLAPSY